MTSIGLYLFSTVAVSAASSQRIGCRSFSRSGVQFRTEASPKFSRLYNSKQYSVYLPGEVRFPCIEYISSPTLLSSHLFCFVPPLLQIYPLTTEVKNICCDPSFAKAKAGFLKTTMYCQITLL